MPLPDHLLNRTLEYDAEFRADGIRATADLVATTDDGQAVVVLVRAGSCRKRSYAMDAAFTLTAAEASGRSVQSVLLYHPRKEYVRRTQLCAAELMICDDITVAARRLLPEVQLALQQIAAISADAASVEADDLKACGRRGQCSYCGAEAAVTLAVDDPRTLFLGRRKGRELVQAGVESLLVLPESVTLTPRQRIQIEAIRQSRPHVDRPALCGFAAQLRYPLRFLDFEAFSLPVPPYPDTRVWEHIPYLYTLQTVAEPGAAAEQTHFCGSAPGDYREQLAGQLMHDLGAEGTIIVYGRDFEARMLRRLGDWVPPAAQALGDCVERVIDLAQPFREFWYYHHLQRGSLSMKTVLPLLGGIGYEDLKIHNGLEANAVFSTALLESRPLKPAEQTAVIEYCARDTAGMARMTEALLRLCQDGTAC